MPYEREKITKTLGRGTCGNCGHQGARIVQMKNGYLCSQCPDDFDGGCKTQLKADSEKGSILIAARVLKWKEREDRERIMGGGASSAPAAPDPEQKPSGGVFGGLFE